MSTKKCNITISIDRELNERWTEVSKKVGWSKASMVETFIKEILPIMENTEDPRLMVSLILKKSAKVNKEIAELLK